MRIAEVLLLIFWSLTGCKNSESIFIPQAILVEKLPHRCGEYDIVSGKIDHDGIFQNRQNERVNLLNGFDTSGYKGKAVLLYGKYWSQYGGLLNSDESDASFKILNLLEAGLIDEIKYGYIDRVHFDDVYRSLKKKEKVMSQKALCQEEQTHSRNWVKVWDTCSGYTALKKDGSLWQFGNVGECNLGQIVPVDLQTGKAVYEQKRVYYLESQKIGEGFNGAFSDFLVTYERG